MAVNSTFDAIQWIISCTLQLYNRVLSASGISINKPSKLEHCGQYRMVGKNSNNLSAKGNHLMAKCALTLAMKLLSRKMLAGPASMVYGELFLALACRKEWGESRGTEI